MIKKFHIDCQYLIHKLPEHKKIKNKLLSLIDKAENKRVFDEGSETDISKADWFHAGEFSKREWCEFLKPFLVPVVIEMCKELGFDGFKMWEIWFQQYYNKDSHGWHSHSANWTNVYYLELPENAPKTQIVNPYTKEVLTIDIKEGDILMFPSFILHRAPPIENDVRKTIISYNLDSLYSNEVYGKSIKY